MGQISLETPVTGQPDLTEDPKIAANFQTLQTVINGNLDRSNISPSVVGSAGATNIATSESRTNTAYGTLATPDQVTGLVVPANGLILVLYQATWRESVNGAANAALFINSNQLQTAQAGLGAPYATSASIGTGAGGEDVVLSSVSYGLGSFNNAAVFNSTYTGDVTTGQSVGGGAFGFTASTGGGSPTTQLVLGGPCYIFGLAAGTYTVSVRFKASSGSVTAKNRRLWAAVVPFG